VELGAPYLVQVYNSASLSGALTYSMITHDSQHTGKYNLIHASELSGTFVSIQPAETQALDVVYGDSYVYVDYINPESTDTRKLLTWLYVLAAFVGFLTVLAIIFIAVKIVATYRKRGYSELAK